MKLAASNNDLTTFIIPSIDRPTLQRAIQSAWQQGTVLYEIDEHRIGEAAIRNKLIAQATTEWVSMLDDDDTVTSDYAARLREELRRDPTADVVFFREYFIGDYMKSEMEDHFIPVEPKIEWGNIGISFSVRRELAQQHPFIEQEHEDLRFIEALAAAGANIVFSKYITYHARH